MVVAGPHGSATDRSFVTIVLVEAAAAWQIRETAAVRWASG
jgi:hypothetical protein